MTLNYGWYNVEKY